MKLLTKLFSIGIDSTLTKEEAKLIKLLNYICISWCSILIFKIILDNSLNLNPKNSFLTTCAYFGQFFILIFSVYFQHKKKYEIARILLITTSPIQTFIFCNFLNKGNLIEVFYIMMPLLSLLFLKKKIYHYFFLVVSILCLSFVPELFNIYPEARTELVTIFPILFIVIFLFFSYFKNINIKNETLLKQEREIIEKDKVKIEQQASELKELNEFQTHFFINITHELRTSLTLIKGKVFGANKMSPTSNIQEKLDGILRHSNKIERLINDIIDVTKAKTNTLTLSLELHNLNNIIQKQYVAFKTLFEDKEINFSYTLLNKNVIVEIDKLYFTRVIGNILVNAAKYTLKGGNVTIFITTNNNQLQIDIEDNGIGIPLEEEEKIFNRFYQVNNDINKASGSGIGLAFCKEVIQLQKGNVIAMQNKFGGATFRITLPTKYSISSNPVSNHIITTDNSKPTLLLVDDNAEMRTYISSLLIDYNIIEARDGIEALEILETQFVNALITDYMMPKMNGYELIKELKKRKYSFPILVITARADVKSKLDVLALGIDDYLTKPFLEEELIYRLRYSLLNAKNRTEYQKEALSKYPEESNIIEENDLLIKSRSIIENNIGNTSFGIPNLVEALSITERTLYRKIKTHSGLTPNQFIREIKLLYVHNLVEQDKFTSLNQLTKKVGFKNTSHLQKIYKERFGKTLSI